MLRRTAILGTLIVLLVAPWVGARTQPAASVPACEIPFGEPSFHPDAEVSTWEGDVDASATPGDLEVRSYSAGAWIVPWSKDRWRVEIGEVDPQDTLQATVDASEGERFDLTAVVEPRERETLPSALPVSPSTSPDGFAQVKVRVPAGTYERIVASDQPPADNGTIQIDNGSGDGTQADWVDVRVHDLPADAVEVSTDNGGAYLTNGTFRDAAVTADNGRVGLRDVSSDRTAATVDNGSACGEDLVVGAATLRSDNGAMTFTDLQGTSIGATTDNGRIDLSSVRAESLDLTLDNGNLDVADVEASDGIAAEADNGDLEIVRARASSLSVRTDNGNLRLRDSRTDSLTMEGDNHDANVVGVAVRDVTYTSDNGNLEADLLPTASGDWSLTADNGEIDLHVITGDRYGYDAKVTTDNGEPELEIPGTYVVSRSENEIHVRTEDYGDRAIRTKLRVQSDNGGITADNEVRSTGGLLLGQVQPSTAAAGAGVAAGIVAVLGILWAKGKIALGPLYTRITRDEVLDNATRRRILDLVRREPGIHFRGIKRNLGVGRGVLEHHLDKLVEAGFLAEQATTAYRCYFPHGAVDRRIMEAAPKLRADSARQIISALSREPADSLGQLADRTELTSSTASYHLGRLADAGLVHRDRDGSRLSVELTPLGKQAIDELALT